MNKSRHLFSSPYPLRLLQLPARLMAVLLLLLLPLLTAAADDTQPPPEETADQISFAGGYTRASMKGGQEAIFLSGGAWVRTGTIYIQADSIDLYGEGSRFIACRGNVLLDEEEQDIRLNSNMLTYDRETGILTVNGWAEMLDRGNQMIAKGAYLRLNREDEAVLIQVNVSIMKTDEEENELYCRADSAYFGSENNSLELTGQAWVSYNGSEYEASRILIDMDTNEITMEGGVSGTINESQ